MLSQLLSDLSFEDISSACVDDASVNKTQQMEVDESKLSDQIKSIDFKDVLYCDQNEYMIEYLAGLTHPFRKQWLW